MTAPSPSIDTPELLRRIAELEARVASLAKQLPEDRATLLVISGDMEKVHTALTLAHASAALGLETAVYFAMWGVQALRTGSSASARTWVGRGLDAFLARSIDQLPSGRLNFGGIGPRIFTRLMKKKSMPTGAELLDLAPPCGIELVCCPMSLDMLEIPPDELRPDVEIRGAASFVELAQRSRFAALF